MIMNYLKIRKTVIRPFKFLRKIKGLPRDWHIYNSVVKCLLSVPEAQGSVPTYTDTDTHIQRASRWSMYEVDGGRSIRRL